ncbi:hypothetical protein P8452_17261 [Trifolium repens]|nr:hypothetical protein P8452_17261 [Trifolium repens]
MGNTFLYDVLTLETKRLLKQGQQWSLVWKKNGVFGENVNRETEGEKKGWWIIRREVRNLVVVMSELERASCSDKGDGVEKKILDLGCCCFRIVVRERE